VKKYLSVLSRCPLFSGIEPENILTMLSCMDAQIIKTPKNHPVFREGTPAKYVGLVLSGRVQVVRHTICGSRHIIAATDPAQIFGAAFACAAVETLPVSAIAQNCGFGSSLCNGFPSRSYGVLTKFLSNIPIPAEPEILRRTGALEENIDRNYRIAAR